MVHIFSGHIQRAMGGGASRARYEVQASAVSGPSRHEDMAPTKPIQEVSTVGASSASLSSSSSPSSSSPLTSPAAAPMTTVTKSTEAESPVLSNTSPSSSPNAPFARLPSLMEDEDTSIENMDTEQSLIQTSSKSQSMNSILPDLDREDSSLSASSSFSGGVNAASSSQHSLINKGGLKKPKSLDLSMHKPMHNVDETTGAIMSNDNLLGQALSRHNSIRAMALRQNSRQENLYIPQELVKAASFLITKNSNHSLKTDSSNSLKDKDGSSNSFKVHDSSRQQIVGTENAVGGEDKQKALTHTSGGNSAEASVPLQVQNIVPHTKPRIRPNLSIQLDADPVDDPDWIQVSDDEFGDEKEDGNDAVQRGTLNKNAAMNQSYLFTQSGTIFIDGFNAGIGKKGIQGSNSKGGRTVHKLPMKERLCVLCKLGQGASSIVYKALDLSEMRLVAVKMISVFDRAKRRQMVRELSALFQMLRSQRKPVLQHNFSVVSNTISMIKMTSGISEAPDGTSAVSPCIVEFYDAFSNLEDGGVALMMEYMDGGSLQDIVDLGGCKDEPTLANIARQALQGLHFMHSCNQIHRDIKPGNLLINALGEVKVSDLGILRQVDPVEQQFSSETGADNELNNKDDIAEDGKNLCRVNSFVGTATYMSPERIDGRDYGFASDVWALGLSLLTLVGGKLPIDTSGGYWTILNSIRDQESPSLPASSNHSSELRDFIDQCLRKDAAERPTCAELLEHPFLRKGYIEDIHDGHTVERGLNELRAILMALYSHLDKLKAEWDRNSSDVPPPTAEEIKRKEASMSDKAERRSYIYNEFKDKTPAKLMEEALFGERQAGDDENTADDTSGTGNSSKVSNDIAASRLAVLAEQLRIPIEDAVDAASMLCWELGRKGKRATIMQDWASTPKTVHSKVPII